MRDKFVVFLPEHGDYDDKSKKWFCSYWMSEDEWMDLHYYFPSTKAQSKKEEKSGEP